MKIGLFIKNFLNSWVMPYPQSLSTNSTDALAMISTIKLIQPICTKLLYVLGTELCTLHNYIYYHLWRAYCVQGTLPIPFQTLCYL